MYPVSYANSVCNKNEPDPMRKKKSQIDVTFIQLVLLNFHGYPVGPSERLFEL